MIHLSHRHKIQLGWHPSRIKCFRLHLASFNRVVSNYSELQLIFKMKRALEAGFKGCKDQNLKQNGFNLEDTHMKCPERLGKLMAVCAFATALCIKMGKARHAAVELIPYKKTYLYSVFQYGLNHLRCIADDVLRWISGAKLRRNYSIHSMDYALVAKK